MKRNHMHFGTTLGSVLLAVLMLVAVRLQAQCQIMVLLVVQLLHKVEHTQFQRVIRLEAQ